jgi:subtilisin family serine protease
VNGLEVQGGPIVRAWLAAQPEVGRILNNPILRPLPANPPVARGDAAAPNGIQWNQSMLEADRVWNELHIDGKGIVVGQSDSGVQGDHPDLQSTYRGTVAGNDYNWLDPWNHTQKPTDIGGHGTHTLGIILGKKTGIAPGATWIGCVNLARNLGNPSVYLNCMQFMLAPYPQNGDPFRDGDPTQSAMVLNNSWGCPDIEGCDPESLAAAVNALKAAGIFVVASAGNSGDAGCGSVQDPPAIYASAYSVGAIDEKGNLASFSSLGPVSVDGSNRVKPDILAPGVDVLSTFPGNTYQVESGTSMAGPHIVGVVALIWSANPTLIGDIDRTTSILDQSTKAYKGQYPACVNSAAKPNDAAGWGVVDAYQAVKLALQEK